MSSATILAEVVAQPAPPEEDRGIDAARWYDSARRPPPYIEELHEAWRYRDLLVQLVGRDLKIRYRRSVLGVIWTMLNPLLMMIVLTLVFSHLFRFQVANYPVYLLSATIMWMFISQSTTAAMSQLQWGSSLFSKIYVPRTIFALSAVGTQLVNFAIATVPLLAVTVILGVPLTPALVWLPIPMALAAIFAVGVGLLISSVALVFRDILEMYQIFLTAWYFLTPVMYPRSIVPDEYQAVIALNPIASLVDAFRQPIYAGIAPTAETLLTATAWSLALAVAGWIVFSARADQVAYRL